MRSINFTSDSDFSLIMDDGGNYNDEALCNICSKVLESDDKALFYEEFCKKWYCCACAHINSGDYCKINEVAGHNKWYHSSYVVKVDKLVDRAGDLVDLLKLGSTVERLLNIVNSVMTIYYLTKG